MPADPNQVYRGSLVVNFTIRFDEALLRNAPTPAPVSTAQAASHPARGSAAASTQPMVTGVDETPKNGSNTHASFVLNRVPKKASVSMPSTRQAGTFDLTFDFRDLALDARTLRAAAVEIHMGTVSHDNFGAGMRQTNPQQRRLSQLNLSNPDTNARTLMMVGIVDEWEVEYKDDGAEVSIKGRDLRGLLIDSPLQVTALNGMNLEASIDNIVREILSKHPLCGRLQVVVNPAEWPNGVVPAGIPSSIIPRHRRGARGNRLGGVLSPPGTAGMNESSGAGGELTYWDAIVRLCFLLGAIPYFAGRQLVIRPARGYYDQARAGFDPNIATPFLPDQPRNEPGMGPFVVRRMVYGRNTSSVTFARKLGGHSRPRAVRVVSVDHGVTNRAAPREVEATWPPPRTPQGPQSRNRRTAGATAPPVVNPVSGAAVNPAATTVAPSGGGSQTDVQNVRIGGITDPVRLREIARGLFEEMSRNEMTGSCSTKNLASFGGDNSDPDLLRMRPGDAVEFFIDTSAMGAAQSSIVGTVTDHFRAPFEQAVAELAATLGDQNLARAILVTARGQVNSLQRFFRVSSVSYDWDGDGGIGVKFDFQNYFVIRNDPPGASGAAGATPSGALQYSTVPTREVIG